MVELGQVMRVGFMDAHVRPSRCELLPSSMERYTIPALFIVTRFSRLRVCSLNLGYGLWVDCDLA